MMIGGGQRGQTTTPAAQGHGGGGASDCLCFVRGYRERVSAWSTVVVAHGQQPRPPHKQGRGLVTELVLRLVAKCIIVALAHAVAGGPTANISPGHKPMIITRVASFR